MIPEHEFSEWISNEFYKNKVRVKWLKQIALYATSNKRLLFYSKSHKVATQANVRNARGMQMDSVLLDICMF